jgi:hypothetical protein
MSAVGLGLKETGKCGYSPHIFCVPKDTGSGQGSGLADDAQAAFFNNICGYFVAKDKFFF